MEQGEDTGSPEIAALERTVLESVRSSGALAEVATVWGRLGLSDAIRQTRRQALGTNIGDLLNEIVQGEQKLEKSMENSLEANLKELSHLCQQLSLPPEKFPEDLSLYDKEKSTRQRVDVLDKIKFEREKRLKRIIEMEKSLCKELGEQSVVYASKTRLPSEEDLRGYLKRVETLEQTLAERRKRRVDLVGKVKEVKNTLELELEESDYSFLLETEFVYTSQHMDTLETEYKKFENFIRNLESRANELRDSISDLWQRLEVPETDRDLVLDAVHSFKPKDIDLLNVELERLVALKREHMESFIAKTREELQQIWEQCMYGEQQQHEFSPAFTSAPYDDDLLSAHESEVDRMRGYYRDNASIYELLKKRDDMFNQLCELERKDSDPSRLSNRGGQLLRDQAKKKQLTKELPRVEKTLREMLQSWEDDHERLFIVHDNRYLDTIEHQWREKEDSKNQEKVKRQKEKEAAIMLEMTYGSKPSTPKSLKRSAASPLPPATAPSKMRKIDASPGLRPITGSGSRLPRGKTATSKTSSKFVTKTPLRHNSQRSDRRKILRDRNVAGTLRGSSPEETVSSCNNLSLASTLSYTDFQHGIMGPSGDQKRSTVFPKNSSHIEH